MEYSSDSESVATNSTFDDSYFDPASEVSYEFRQSNLYNYVADAQAAIQNHDDISIENALYLNGKYRQMLEDLRTKFEKMLQQVKEKYADNEELLEKLRLNVPGKQVSMRFSSIYICGAPYFKDNQLNPSPMNADYLYRRDVMQEFFPIDMMAQMRRFWVTSDKLDITGGVKEQILNHFKAQNSSSISSIRNQNKISRSLTKKIATIRDITADMEKRPFVELYDMARNSDCEIDWEKVSFKNLDSRHGPTECEAMWKHYLQPDLNHAAWSQEEDEELLNSVIVNNYQDWEKIAKNLGNRSALHCFVHYRTTLSENAQVKKNEKFDQFEDKQLLELVEKYSTGDVINWGKVCQQMPGRNRYQCYHRYMFTLKPGIKKERFTFEEDCKILAYVQVHGENFGNMPPSLLLGRTGVQIRNRYNNTLKHEGNNVWTPDEDEQLYKFALENGTNSWSQISRILKTKTRFACRCRYHTIKKHLEKYPNSTVRDIPTKTKSRSTPLSKKNYAALAQNVNTTPGEISKELQKQVHDMSNKKKKLHNKKIVPYMPEDAATKNLYNYMKFSYDWVYYPRRSSVNFTEEEIVRLYVTLQIFDFELNKDDFTMRFNCMPIRDQSQLSLALQVLPNEDMQEGIRLAKTYGVYFAPNWNSIVAYRGVQMLLKQPRKNERVVQRPKIMQYLREYMTFKRRFVQMFYWTALVAKLKINLVQEHWNTRCMVETHTIEDSVPEIIVTKVEPISVDDDDDDDDADSLMDSTVEVQVEETESEKEESEEENAVDFLLNYVQQLKEAKAATEQSQSEACVYEITCLDEVGDTNLKTSQVVRRDSADSSKTSPKCYAKRKPSMPLT